ncbi:hypothetical protein GCM10027217_18830 [Pseudomaricurvus hydrocarbonicus]
MITIDTEFSIAGHFQDPDNLKPVSHPLVYGETHSGQQGLGFILDTFSSYDVTGTFFVETANASYFGDGPIATVINDLQKANQDIQLHVHPVWLSFDKSVKAGQFPRQDDCAGQTYSYLKQVFSICLDTFKRLTGRMPEAIRTGNLRADVTTYQVIRDLGIPLSSNIATGVFTPPDQRLHLDSGRHHIEGVMEMPVFTYQDGNLFGRDNKKSLQITSCSWPEMKCILLQARRLGIEQVVILTHPFEFFKSADPQYKTLTRNRVNQNRLLQLCRFIKEHNQDFVAADFGSHRHCWGRDKTDPPLGIPGYYALGRKLHNKLNDSLWYY